MLKLAFFTAMRTGEIFSLREDDVDFHYDIILVNNPNGGKSVSIPLNSPAREVLLVQLAW